MLDAFTLFTRPLIDFFNASHVIRWYSVCLVRLLRHHLRQLERRDIGAAGSARGERFPLDRLLGRPIRGSSPRADRISSRRSLRPPRPRSPRPAGDLPLPSLLSSRDLVSPFAFAAAHPRTRNPATAPVGRPRVILIAFIATRTLATAVAV